MCKQEQGESIRSYVKRFFHTRATIPNVTDDDIIDYFQSGITVQSLYHDFGRNRPKTVVELCWRFLCPIIIDILQANRITAVALHLGVFQGIVFFLREALWKRVS